MALSSVTRQMSEMTAAPQVEVSDLLKALRDEVRQKAKCRLTKDGLFKAVLKASFVRIHEYTEFVYSDKPESGPDSFFGSAPLRQCCEDLIALKYLAKLKRKDRDAVIQALIGNGWQLQDAPTRLPGRFGPGATSFDSASDLASAFRRAEVAHGEHEKRIGQRDANWPDWYAAYIVAEQSGKVPPQ